MRRFLTVTNPIVEMGVGRHGCPCELGKHSSIQLRLIRNKMPYFLIFFYIKILAHSPFLRLYNAFRTSVNLYHYPNVAIRVSVQ